MSIDLNANTFLFWSGRFVEGLESVKTRLEGKYMKLDEKYQIWMA